MGFFANLFRNKIRPFKDGLDFLSYLFNLPKYFSRYSSGAGVAIIIFAVALSNIYPDSFLGKIANAKPLAIDGQQYFLTEEAGLSEEAELANSDLLYNKLSLSEKDVVNPVDFNENINLPSIDGLALLPNTNPDPYMSGYGQDRTQVMEYIVQAGDSVSSIAAYFGITTNTVLWANNLTERSIISVGKKLIILPVSGVRHKIVKKDTLKSISLKYKSNMADILEFNQITQDTPLTIGDYLIIPGGKISASVIPTSPSIKSFVGSLVQLDGYFIFPTIGRISQGLHPTNAVDIANRSLPPVYAAADGIIILTKSSGWNGGYGKYIRVRHPNGVETLYAHLSEIHVSVGQSVAQGQVIARMGNTGHSTGPHLHWEVRGAANPLIKYR